MLLSYLIFNVTSSINTNVFSYSDPPTGAVAPWLQSRTCFNQHFSSTNGQSMHFRNSLSTFARENCDLCWLRYSSSSPLRSLVRVPGACILSTWCF